jgi:hypothetical protein
VCAWLVALFPTDRDSQAPGVPGFSVSELSIHGTSAVLLFLCLAWVAWRCAGNTLELLPPNHRDLEPMFRRLYRGCAVLMVALPLTAFALGLVARLKQDVFIAELLGIWVFAAYWWIKHRELSLSRAEDQALTGKLDAWKPAPAAAPAAPTQTPVAPAARLASVRMLSVLFRLGQPS